MMGHNPPPKRLLAKSEPIRDSLAGHALFHFLAHAESILLPLLGNRRRK